jgi:hypothetical protein
MLLIRIKYFFIYFIYYRKIEYKIIFGLLNNKGLFKSEEKVFYLFIIIIFVSVHATFLGIGFFPVQNGLENIQFMIWISF